MTKKEDAKIKNVGEFETRAPRMFGYARVSTRNQKEDRQLDAFAKVNIPKENIFVDHMSGADFNRPAYRKLLKVLRKGDILVITSLDRFGRDYMETIEQWRVLSIEVGVSLIVLDNANFNFSATPQMPVIEHLMRELVLNVMAFIAQTERDNIKARQSQGIAAAQKRGVKFGRPRRAKPEEFDAIAERVRCGKISKKAGARLLGLPASTFCSMLGR